MRDSFSYRICDDLSEVILSFLTFEDKIHYECVSKQFKRTIFQKQYKLIIEPKFDINYQNKSFSDPFLK